MAIRTAILGEVRLFRDGLTRLLRESSRVEVVASAGALGEAEEQVERERPDVLLLDVSTADGLRQLRALAAPLPRQTGRAVAASSYFGMRWLPEVVRAAREVARETSAFLQGDDEPRGA